MADETAYVINRMLNKDPDQRFNNYDELIDHFEYALQRVGEEGPKRVHVVKEQSRKEQVETSRLFGMVTLLLVLITLAGGITLFVLKDRIWGEKIDPNSPEGKHRAATSFFIRDAKSGGCSVGIPPDNLGFRLVRRPAWHERLVAWLLPDR